VAAAAGLDDQAPRLAVHEQLGARVARAQAGDRARLVGGELVLHATMIGRAPEHLISAG
jgi:hypothetical protein